MSRNGGKVGENGVRVIWQGRKISVFLNGGSSGIVTSKTYSKGHNWFEISVCMYRGLKRLAIR